MELSDWFKGFEKGIAKLSEEQRMYMWTAQAGLCLYTTALRMLQAEHHLCPAFPMARQNLQRDNLRVRPSRQQALQDADFGTP